MQPLGGGIREHHQRVERAAGPRRCRRGWPRSRPTARATCARRRRARSRPAQHPPAAPEGFPERRSVIYSVAGMGETIQSNLAVPSGRTSAPRLERAGTSRSHVIDRVTRLLGLLAAVALAVLLGAGRSRIGRIDRGRRRLVPARARGLARRARGHARGRRDRVARDRPPAGRSRRRRRIGGRRQPGEVPGLGAGRAARSAASRARWSR